MATKGAYILVLELKEQTTISFGATRTVDCPAGFYCYTGSAYGPGGFKRVDRHLDRFETADPSDPHWHIDYLIDAATRLLGDLRQENGSECELATEIADQLNGISQIGATDCDCDTHLFRTADKPVLETTLDRIDGDLTWR